MNKTAAYPVAEKEGADEHRSFRRPFVAIPTVIALILLAVALAICARADARKKLIATGWDSPFPAQFRQSLAQFELWPFDGTTVKLARQLPDGTVADALYAFTGAPWSRDDFTNAIADLKAAKPSRPLDNFLLLHANPGNVDWFDDAGWREIADHWRLFAWVARQSGFKGILFDAEPYTAPHMQFRYHTQSQRDRHAFEEYAAKARERGREVMQAVVAEYPDIVILTYRLLCDLPPVLTADGSPTALLETHYYGLLPSFLNGWFDAASDTLMVIEGNENAYAYNSDRQFERAYVDLRTRAAAFIAPEHQVRFRAQYRIGHGIYLDAHVNPPSSPWYIDRLGGAPAARLRVNVGAALRTADEYVWIYGEKGRWWASGDSKRPFWPELLPGADQALSQAADPTGAARRKIAASAPEENLLANGSFSILTAKDVPESWWLWQGDKSEGKMSVDAGIGATVPGSARIDGAQSAVFGQTVKVAPGGIYAASVKVMSRGHGYAGVNVRWKNASGKWLERDHDVRLSLWRDAAPGGWRELAGTLQAPESAVELFMLLTAQGQRSTNDVAWFDDARLVGF